MGRKKKATAENADNPTLFKNGTQEPEAARFELQAAAAEANKALRGIAGVYQPLITPALKERAKAYYLAHVDRLRETLTAAGAKTDLINAVLNDYATVLYGPRDFAATAGQMRAALEKISPVSAFNIDRYGLYRGLFIGYQGHIKALDEYVKRVKDEGPGRTAIKTEFFSDATDLDSQGILWLMRSGVLLMEDWAAYPPANFLEFIEKTKQLAALRDYTQIYTLARYAYLANGQEMAEIVPPDIYKYIKTPGAIDDAACAENEYLQSLGITFAEFAADQEKNDRETATDWDKTLQLYEVPNIILSRPVRVSPNQTQITNTLPIQKYITDFTEKNPAYNMITPMTVQKVFEAVNLLPQYFKGTRTANEFSYSVNISEFARICGYDDANQEQKKALLGALLMLNNLYIVVDRPYKCVTTVNFKGKEIKRKVGGMTAINVIRLKEIGLQTGELVIDIAPDAMQGRPTLITKETYKKLRAEAKGLTQSRFNAQLLTKEHKAEESLTAEVFGYDDMIRNAETGEELKRVKEYIRKHKGADQKKIKSWFEQYQEKGVLTYSYNKQAKAYNWDIIDARALQIGEQ